MNNQELIKAILILTHFGVVRSDTDVDNGIIMELSGELPKLDLEKQPDPEEVSDAVFTILLLVANLTSSKWLKRLTRIAERIYKRIKGEAPDERFIKRIIQKIKAKRESKRT